jgi:hyperosmotically inducible periplasmic protein
MRMLPRFAAVSGLAMLLTVPALVQARTGVQLTPLEDSVRHAIVTLPYYGVFDDISFRVDGNVVTLMGAVTGPGFLKDDAGKAVKRIEGVTAVRNDIEILPLSPIDDQIRMRMYRAIFRDPQLGKYSMGAVPPLHIIVKNGHVTLTGVVLNEMDRTVAYLRANAVPGVFSVTNNLQVER